MIHFRPSAVPLVTVDPFFSIWSMSDALYEDVTHHWCGRRNPMTAAILLDGQPFKVMGQLAPNSDRDIPNYEARIPQTNLTVTPTRTIYTFANDTIRVELIFTSPLLLDRIDILARPVSYIEYDIQILDGKEHDVTFHFDISSECSIDTYDASVVCKKTAQSLCCGNAVQKVLSKSGDGVCIDWGYLHLAESDAKFVNGFSRFSAEPTELDFSHPHKVFEEYPYLMVRKKDLHGVITIAYDDIHPVSYLGKFLDDYYKNFFSGFDEMLTTAKKEYEDIKELCIAFDRQLMTEASAFGKKYEKLASLAYRQVIAAHKLVADQKGNILFLSKECHSNGCIGTLDVTYPSIPLFLKYNPELVKGMLRPILDFANSEDWHFDFTPHDVGQYPLADRQVYGYQKGLTREEELASQMPVEECGNMLICVAAVAKAEKNDSFARDNQEILKAWADYLVTYGYDPGNQLCTDDFAGHLAHNCNLSLKAILGIASYGMLFNDSHYLEIAKEYAKKWEQDAANTEGTRLAFHLEDSWSLKYNIIWDKLLNYHLFSDNVFEKEIALYRSKKNRYGSPLDNRSDYTKLDWLMWTTAMTEDESYREEVINCIYDFVNETPSRVPICDWYFSSTGEMVSFQNRTVLGGLYIPLLS